MISAALLFRSGRSETVSWQVCCPVNIAPTEGLFDSFLRRAIMPILGRSRKALFPYRESYKEPKSLVPIPGILQVRRDAARRFRRQPTLRWRGGGHGNFLSSFRRRTLSSQCPIGRRQRSDKLPVAYQRRSEERRAGKEWR